MESEIVTRHSVPPVPLGEDVVLLGEAMIDEKEEERRPPVPPESGERRLLGSRLLSSTGEVADCDDSLLTASDIREEIHQELTAFAAQSLRTELMALGAMLKRDFRSMLQEALSKNQLSVAGSTTTVKNETQVSSMMDPVDISEKIKEDMRELIQSELTKTREDYVPPSRSRVTTRLPIKQKPAAAQALAAKEAPRANPLSARPYRTFVAHTAMQQFDVKVLKKREAMKKKQEMDRKEKAQHMTVEAASKIKALKRAHTSTTVPESREEDFEESYSSEEQGMKCAYCACTLAPDSVICVKCGRANTVEEAWGPAKTTPCKSETLDSDSVEVFQLEVAGNADKDAGQSNSLSILPNGDKSPRSEDAMSVDLLKTASGFLPKTGRGVSVVRKFGKSLNFNMNFAGRRATNLKEARQNLRNSLKSVEDALETRPRQDPGERHERKTRFQDWDVMSEDSSSGQGSANLQRSSTLQGSSSFQGERASASRDIGKPVAARTASALMAPGDDMLMTRTESHASAVPNKMCGKSKQRTAVFITKEAQSTPTTDKSRSRMWADDDYHSSPLRAHLAKIVNSVSFDIMSGLLIAFNALWIGIQVDIMAARGKDLPLPGYFRALDTTFAVLFAMELVFRLYVFRLEFFFMKGRQWNFFDIMLVGFQVTEEILAWSAFFSGDEMAGNSTNFSFMRILRILRFIRVLRLVRIVRLIGELRTIVCSIAGSLKSLGWTIVLLTLLIYVVGIYFTQLVSDHAHDDEDLAKFFGSVSRSLLSLFAAFTGGVDWDTMASPLIDGIHPLCGVVFALYIAFAVLAMMNVVTGVFVESALMTARHDKDVDLVNTLREVFMKTDEDSTGTIEWTEFEKHIEDPQMEVIFKAVDLDRSEARGLFELIDVENTGEISREEFIMGCLRLKGPAKALDLATLMYDIKRVTNMIEEHFGYIETTMNRHSMAPVTGHESLPPSARQSLAAGRASEQGTSSSQAAGVSSLQIK